LTVPPVQFTTPVSSCIMPPSTLPVPQREFTHTCPVGQRWLHPPQWNGSLVVLAQYPEQLVVPPMQVVVPEQRPPEHDWPDGHALLHIPQWPGSVCVLAQYPEQLTVPPVQETPVSWVIPPPSTLPEPQREPAHTWPVGQRLLHAPQ